MKKHQILAAAAAVIISSISFVKAEAVIAGFNGNWNLRSVSFAELIDSGLNKYPIPIPEPGQPKSVKLFDIGGASYCEQGADKRMVCGGKSASCPQGTDGRMACGGAASNCSYGPDGRMACGGKAASCFQGTDGRMACGGDLLTED